MNGIEEKNFYKKDKKQYELRNNKEFLKYLKDIINNGYVMNIDIDMLQKLIDIIVQWYEWKYPEKEFKHNWLQSKPMSKMMTIDELQLRLTSMQEYILNCPYSAGLFFTNDKNETMTSIKMMKKNISHDFFESDYIMVDVKTKDGNVSVSEELKKYINKDEIALEKLFDIFNEKYSDEFELHDLKECVFNHQCSVELRNIIIQLAAIKLLYSKNTDPDFGYKRAIKLIDEFNNELGLSISTETINTIMNQDYTGGYKYVEIEKNQNGVVSHHGSYIKINKKVKMIMEKIIEFDGDPMLELEKYTDLSQYVFYLNGQALSEIKSYSMKSEYIPDYFKENNINFDYILFAEGGKDENGEEFSDTYISIEEIQEKEIVAKISGIFAADIKYSSPEAGAKIFLKKSR